MVPPPILAHGNLLMMCRVGSDLYAACGIPNLEVLCTNLLPTIWKIWLDFKRFFFCSTLSSSLVGANRRGWRFSTLYMMLFYHCLGLLMANIASGSRKLMSITRWLGMRRVQMNAKSHEMRCGRRFNEGMIHTKDIVVYIDVVVVSAQKTSLRIAFIIDQTLII